MVGKRNKKLYKKMEQIPLTSLDYSVILIPPLKNSGQPQKGLKKVVDKDLQLW